MAPAKKGTISHYILAAESPTRIIEESDASSYDSFHGHETGNYFHSLIFNNLIVYMNILWAPPFWNVCVDSYIQSCSIGVIVRDKSGGDIDYAIRYMIFKSHAWNRNSLIYLKKGEFMYNRTFCASKDSSFKK